MKLKKVQKAFILQKRKVKRYNIHIPYTYIRGEIMNKEEFNKLEVIYQIDYINQKLKETSLTKICDEVGIARSTIRGRFKKLGYELVDNQYINNSNITDITTITKNTPTTKHTENTELEARMNKFETELEQIKNLLKSTIITDSNITKTTSITKKINIYTNEPITRQFRIDAEVQKRFKAFCKANSEHRISDMISQALEEFMDKFK